MARQLLSDDKWELIADQFPEPKLTGRPRRDPRQIINGVLWILRTGAPCRDLSEEFGPWQSAWRLFDQWNSDGTLDAVSKKLQSAFVDIGAINNDFAINNDLWCIDGTIVRAARCESGGEKK